MSGEIEVSVLGVKVRYKKVGRIPITLEPCKPIIIDSGKILSRERVVVHCDADGTTSTKRIKA